MSARSAKTNGTDSAPTKRSFVIEIHPRKVAFDPLARSVGAELLEAGESEDAAKVSTQRLYKLTGILSETQIDNVAKTLLVDPVVETYEVSVEDEKNKKTKNAGWVLDVWPKPGVTDPVGETVRKGLRDLGIHEDVETSTGQRYIFPNIKDADVIRHIAKKTLANELINDIIIARPH